jgi:hypothetical protein
MWRFRLPQRNPDRWLAALLVAALPAIACIVNGVGVIETIVTAALIGGVIVVIH